MDTAVALMQAYLNVNGYRFPDAGENLVHRSARHVPEAGDVSRRLLRHGRAGGGHEIRVVAFGQAPDSVRHGPWLTVPMRHVVEYLQQHLRDHWRLLRRVQIHDEGLAVLALMEKWGLGRGATPQASIRREV
ncbi:MAG: hypothetical protein Q8Q02_07250 [Nocardioides sp.]|nr:hypothetical protein [Nocardioides sp.]